MPPGMLHAIGAGTFLVEVQEPEDLSILLEWRDFAIDGRADGHLGLGFPAALTGVERTGRSAAAIDALITSNGRGDSILASASEEFFRLGRHTVQAPIELEGGFAVLVVVAGAIRLDWQTGGTMSLTRGANVVVPHAAGRLTASGAGDLLVIRPPVTRSLC